MGRSAAFNATLFFISLRRGQFTCHNISYALHLHFSPWQRRWGYAWLSNSSFSTS